MSSREYMAEYNKKNRERITQLAAERTRKLREAREADPELMAAYKARRREEYLKKKPDAMTREERAASRKPRKVIPKADTRECVDCHQVKPVEQFPRHGTHGRRDFCMACSDVRKLAARKASQKAYEKRNREKINATKRAWAAKQPKAERFDALEKHEPRPVSEVLGDWKTHFTKDGWRCVGGVGDTHEQITAFIRGWVIMYIRGSKGSYSTGKTSFGVIFDDEKPKQMTLAKAEARARNLYK